MRTPSTAPSGCVTICIAIAAIVGAPAGSMAQGASDTERTFTARRISITWTEAPIADVLLAFSVFSGKSIVAGAGITGTVTANLDDAPWDVALQAILSAHGLVAVENAYGIIEVDDMRSLSDREVIEPILTRSYRLSFVPAAEMEAVIAPLLSVRGSISVSASANAVVVSDIARVHRAIGGVVRER